MDIEKLVEGFRAVTTASVADAVDRVLRRPGYMTHQIKPIGPGRVVGPAITVLERASLEAQPPALALQAIDEAEPGSVLVIGMEDPIGAENVAVFGGLMGTGAVTRGMAGAILDAGVRDVEEILGLGFQVFSRTVIPSTTVGRYVTVDRNVPVVCGGVRVHPGDIVVADTDGVVVVPRDAAAEVLEVATGIEATEREMAEEIKRVGSIRKALEKFARI
jgi:4-hydroxy-4-methyl-2-oxoglutarate aldolase